jgi:lysophospholipid hydrolase
VDANLYSSGKANWGFSITPAEQVDQADYVMVIGMGEDPSLGEYERLLLSMKTTARKELVLLHPDRSVVPGSTRGWLKV